MVYLDGNIMQKGCITSAGSKILENYTALFDAETVTRLKEKNMNICGGTKMSEFGIPSFDGDDELEGAVRAVADGDVKYSLCSDVFGQYRRQAAQNGVCCIRPTYGTVSRYGLVPAASSMDQIGVVCQNIEDGFELLSVIAGNDTKDGAMFPDESYSYSKTDKKLRVGVPEPVAGSADENTRKAIREFAANFDPVNIELPYFDVYKQVMYILSCAEIGNNISRYDGIKFGFRAAGYRGLNELYVKTRSEAFGPQAKLAAVMGAMTLSRGNYSKYYEKAMKIRRLIKEAVNFCEYDIIVLPLSVGGGEYGDLSLYALSPLAGLPSVSFSYNGCGIQLVANAMDENALLTAAVCCGKG